jgi:predicted PurR-regulated permease PerM
MDPATSWPRPLRTAGILIAVLAVGLILKLAQAVLMPIALAALIAFVLQPLVKRGQRWGIPRIPAVVAVVVAASVLVGIVGYFASAQVNSLALELPQYSRNIEEKVTALKTWMREGPIERVSALVARIDERTDRRAAEETTRRGMPGMLGDAGKLVPARDAGTAENGALAADAGSPLGGIPFLSAVLGSLGTAGIIIVLVTFFLAYQAEIRDRIVVITGRGALATTTKALQDAGARISRYLLMQFVINASYGLVVGIGLALLGVPYATVWGLLAGCVRYFPYVGPWIGACLPLLLSLVTSSGWTQPLLVAALFIVVELLSNNVMEPLLYGHSVGLSGVAVILAAVIWAWLWGPIGLVLSTPITACLVVLGKHVPGLRIFDQLLGAPPAVSAPIRLYQRLLAGDSAEADELITTALDNTSVVKVCDDLLIPALDLATSDLRAGVIDQYDADQIREQMREFIEDLPREQVSHSRSADAHNGAADGAHARVVGMAARSAEEELALEMLGCTLSETRYRFELLSTQLLLSERFLQLGEDPPDVLCLSLCRATELMHARRICRTARATLPSMKVVVARWLERPDAHGNQQLIEAGATQIVASLEELQRAIGTLLQLQRRKPEVAAPAGA